MGVAERLKYFREQHLDMNQREFGLKVGAAGRDTVYSWEKGKSVPNAKYISAMRNIFRLNPEWLLSGQEPMLLPPEGRLYQPKSNYVLDLHDRPQELNGKLLVDIVAYLEECLEERGNPPVNGRDKGWLIVHLYNRYKDSARLTITKQAVSDSLDHIL